ncbi:hypothetical protein AYO38_03420 [bacterium SCGC AG-212-C10]|nr:hypothetical protein AYO38_03420 [bacterium SCGC AG-212-C10]
MAEIGGRLQAARVSRELTIADVADSTGMHPFFIQSLEADQFEELPAPVYVRGLLRIYANFLGLDPGDFVRKLPPRWRDDGWRDDPPRVDLPTPRLAQIDPEAAERERQREEEALRPATATAPATIVDESVATSAATLVDESVATSAATLVDESVATSTATIVDETTATVASATIVDDSVATVASATIVDDSEVTDAITIVHAPPATPIVDAAPAKETVATVVDERAKSSATAAEASVAAAVSAPVAARKIVTRPAASPRKKASASPAKESDTGELIGATIASSPATVIRSLEPATAASPALGTGVLGSEELRDRPLEARAVLADPAAGGHRKTATASLLKGPLVLIAAGALALMIVAGGVFALRGDGDGDAGASGDAGNNGAQAVAGTVTRAATLAATATATASSTPTATATPTVEPTATPTPTTVPTPTPTPEPTPAPTIGPSQPSVPANPFAYCKSLGSENYDCGNSPWRLICTPSGMFVDAQGLVPSPVPQDWAGWRETVISGRLETAFGACR